MSVSGEDSRHVQCRRFVESPRIVRKQDDGILSATDDATDV
jgi:hypothetical protein